MCKMNGKNGRGKMPTKFYCAPSVLLKQSTDSAKWQISQDGYEEYSNSQTYMSIEPKTSLSSGNGVTTQPAQTKKGLLRSARRF
jgi:hypothetical protein